MREEIDPAARSPGSAPPRKPAMVPRLAIKTLCFLCVCAGAAPTRYLAPAAAGAPKEANARPLSNLKLTLNVSDLFLRGPPEKFILTSVHIECVEDTAECAGAQSKLVDPHAPSLPIRSFRLLASPFRAGVFPRIRFQACRRSHSSR